MATVPVTAEVVLYEYLHSDYSPDREYVDGAIEERNLGEMDHSDVQSELVTLFRNHRDEWHIRAYAELRVQVSPTRYRVPDVCLLREGQRRVPIVVEAPLLCIEILSPEDRFGRIRKKCDEYLAMGVLEAWIIDVAERLVFVLHRDGTMTTHTNGVLGLADTSVAVPLEAIFSVLDEA